MQVGINIIRDGSRPFLAATGAALSSFGSVELTTGHTILAAVLAFLSAILAAYLASRPALLRVRVDRDRQQSERDAEAVTQQIAFLQDRIRYHAAVAVILRNSKHLYGNELASAYKHMWKLEEALRAAGVPCPEYDYKSGSELNEEEDRQMAALALPVEDDPHRTSGTHAQP